MAPFRTCVDSKQHLKKNFHLGRKWSLGARFHLKSGNSLAGDSLRDLARACALEGDRRPHDTNPTRWRSPCDAENIVNDDAMHQDRATIASASLRTAEPQASAAKKVSRAGPEQFAITFPRVCARNCVRSAAADPRFLILKNARTGVRDDRRPLIEGQIPSFFLSKSLTACGFALPPEDFIT
jgi:hypothetical protein